MLQTHPEQARTALKPNDEILYYTNDHMVKFMREHSPGLGLPLLFEDGCDKKPFELANTFDFLNFCLLIGQVSGMKILTMGSGKPGHNLLCAKLGMAANPKPFLQAGDVIGYKPREKLLEILRDGKAIYQETDKLPLSVTNLHFFGSLLAEVCDLRVEALQMEKETLNCSYTVLPPR